MENMSDVESRCRLVLVVPELADINEQALQVGNALKGGDVASVIIPQYALDDVTFQKHAEKLVPIIQDAGAAALICGDSRVAGRVKADGLHIAGNAEAIACFWRAPVDNGEHRPDYIFFGKFDGDIKPEAHPKNLALAEWWSSMIEIPCIAMGGTDPQSALEVAEAGAEFVALRLAVFAEPSQAAIIVAQVNALLDEKAPRFEEE